MSQQTLKAPSRPLVLFITSIFLITLLLFVSEDTQSTSFTGAAVSLEETEQENQSIFIREREQTTNTPTIFNNKEFILFQKIFLLSVGVVFLLLCSYFLYTKNDGEKEEEFGGEDWSE